MRRFAALAALTIAATVAPAPTASAEPQSAPDCRFESARSYEDFGRIRTFTSGGVLYGCLTDVGRAYRLDTGTIRARSAATQRTLFGVGDWVGFSARSRSGETRVRATNLRSGATHGAPAFAPATALVVNYDGTLAWIAGTELLTKASGTRTLRLASDSAIDRGFLGLENDQGCAVTWRSDGEQRSSSIFCSRP
jgi:hypothetical protein